MLWLHGVMVLLATVCAAAPARAAAPENVVRTGGLTIVFNSTATPVSVKNAQGIELLGEGSRGFTLRTNAPNGTLLSEVPFDTMSRSAANALTFGVSGSGEQIGVAFDGASHYLTANFTSARGFERSDREGWGGKSVHFYLVGREDDVLRGIALNYMVNDMTGEDASPQKSPHLEYEAPWENSSWNPRGRFAVYERVDDAIEDETLYDLWVDEGLPHPRVNGTWDRSTAKAWIQAWTEANYDMSNLAMVPRNLSEWREFFPYGKLADAKVLWFNFRAWDWTSIDNVNPHMFPNGKQGLKDFSDDAAKNGFTLSTHRMSGGLDPRDPDYCVKPDPGLLSWGSMTLVKAIGASDTTIVVKPDAGVKIPTQKWDPSSMSADEYQLIPNSWDLGSASIDDEWVAYRAIRPLPGGNWEVTLERSGPSPTHAAGARVRGYLKGNLYFIPDPDTALYEEVAARYANFSNYVRFEDGSFDGAAWFSFKGRWSFYKFATLVYQNLDHPTAVHTSGLLVSPAWVEYRFNAVKAALGGNFTLHPGGCNLMKGYVGHPTPSLDEQSANLFAGLVSNTRDFSVGTDTQSTLDVYRQVGNVAEVLTTVRDYKRGSFAMGQTQRQHMAATAWFKDVRRGVKNTASAVWMVDGDVFRKWVYAGTAVYDTIFSPVSSYVPPRFYTQSGARVQLVLPTALQAGFDRVKVTGRVLPRYNATSPQNFDLFGRMGVGPTLQLSASNPTAEESWDESRLAVHSVGPLLDLSQHQGVGMFVVGDGSGGTLVVRVICDGNVARDYAVPLTFTGERWVEVPAPEQGWRVRNWGSIGKGGVVWAALNYSHVSAVAIGVGYLPPHGRSNVSVTGLQALSQIDEPLVEPRITVGSAVVQTNVTLRAYDMFTLDHDGVFTVYDRDWIFVSNCSVGPLRPTNLANFEMTPRAPANALWLEVGVAGAGETVPNPAFQSQIKS
eukprot:m.130150 g.130150  ORF g.130150 m.130150 type:complete len:951 (+) comp22365_c0_seq6:195-3047(+)